MTSIETGGGRYRYRSFRPTRLVLQFYYSSREATVPKEHMQSPTASKIHYQSYSRRLTINIGVDRCGFILANATPLANTL